ncbi:hypothetical protein F5Y18DRAFT_94631 [Xylariaceae sp. FL1019]|nr:hypothetical protein F5Y18DRAFT_94631 [Xylariaceae sp. FL1019]
MAELEKPFLKGIAKLSGNPQHADVKMYMGEYELLAHAVVLASRSLYFEKALGYHVLWSRHMPH